MPVSEGKVQRRLEILILTINIGLFGKQILNHLVLARTARVVQGRPSGIVRLVNVHLGQKLIQDPGGAVLRGCVHRCQALGVGRKRIHVLMDEEVDQLFMPVLARVVHQLLCLLALRLKTVSAGYLRHVLDHREVPLARDVLYRFFSLLSVDQRRPFQHHPRALDRALGAGVGGDEKLGDPGVVVFVEEEEPRAAIVVADVDIGAVRDQRADGVEVAGTSGEV